KRRGNDCAEAEVRQRPRCMLARRATAEVGAGEQNRGAFRLGPVELEAGVEGTIASKAPIVEQECAEAGALDPLQKLLGNDLVGINVGSLKRRYPTGVRAKRLHGFP